MMKSAHLLSIGGLLLFAIAACNSSPPERELATSSPALTVKPEALAWEPTTVALTLSPGETQQVVVTLRAQHNLPVSTTALSAGLAPLLQVEPDELPVLKEGDRFTLSLTAAIPEEHETTTLTGELSLSRGMGRGVAIPPGLPIELTVRPREPVHALGLEVTPPIGWQVELSPRPEGPIGFNDFDGAYANGGIRPPGGADVAIARFPLPAVSLEDYIDRELRGTVILSREDVVLAGASGKRVSYTADYGVFEDFTHVVYLPRGDRIYKFFLTHYSDDADAASYGALFTEMLESVQFVP